MPYNPRDDDTYGHPHGQYFFLQLKMEKLYSVSGKRKERPGADCGSSHVFFIAKFRLKLKKVGKSTRPFRYNLNQIPYAHTVEVMNRFKG